MADGHARLGADTDTLGLDVREPAVDASSSRVHFNAAGLAAHAALWADILGEDFDEAFNGAGALDTDEGGAPDYWERQNGLDPANGADDLLDPDGDGLTNAEEFLLGGNPLVRDGFRVDLTSAGPFSITFAAIPGRIYTVQGRTSLTTGAPWAAVSGPLFVTEAGPMTYELSPGAATHIFYRVAVSAE